MEKKTKQYVIDFYATAFIEIGEDEDPTEYVDEHWEEVTEQARRYMLNYAEFEVYAL